MKCPVFEVRLRNTNPREMLRRFLFCLALIKTKILLLLASERFNGIGGGTTVIPMTWYANKSFLTEYSKD